MQSVKNSEAKLIITNGPVLGISQSHKTQKKKKKKRETSGQKKKKILDK